MWMMVTVAVATTLACGCASGSGEEEASDTFAIECPDGTRHAVLAEEYDGSESAAILDLCAEAVIGSSAVPATASTTSTAAVDTTEATLVPLEDVAPARSLTLLQWFDRYSERDMQPWLDGTLEIINAIDGGVLAWECPPMLDEYVDDWGPDGVNIMAKFRAGPAELEDAGSEVLAGVTEMLMACGDGRAIATQAGMDRITDGMSQFQPLIARALEERDG